MKWPLLVAARSGRPLGLEQVTGNLLLAPAATELLIQTGNRGLSKVLATPVEVCVRQYFGFRSLNTG